MLPIPLLGFFRKHSTIFDAGILIFIILYFLLNGDIQYNIINLSNLIGFLFVFIAIWITGKHLMLLTRIEKQRIKAKKQSYTNKLSKRSITMILSNVFLGAILSFVASLLGWYGSLGTLPGGELELILMVVFSIVIFFIFYLVLYLISFNES